MEKQTLNLDFISRRREELGITLQEMAEALGFKNASTYLKYERGDYSFKGDHLPTVAQKLGCRLEELFFDNHFAKLANKTGTDG